MSLSDYYKAELKHRLEMKDLDETFSFLGISLLYSDKLSNFSECTPSIINIA